VICWAHHHVQRSCELGDSQHHLSSAVLDAGLDTGDTGISGVVCFAGAGSYYTAKNTRGAIVQQSGSRVAKQAERQTEQNKVEAAQQIEQQAGQVVAVCATSRTGSGCLCNRQTNRQRGSSTTTDRYVIGRVTGTTEGRHQTQAEAAQNQTSRLSIM
jgi:hypothetical protein